jgi:hypothetical protein
MFTYKEWLKVSKIIEDNKMHNYIASVESYINNLEFPKESNLIFSHEPFDKEYYFSSKIYENLKDSGIDYADLEILQKMNRFLNYGGYTTIDWKYSGEKYISYARHFELERYMKNFDKIIILDATSYFENQNKDSELLDFDYRKSDVIYLDNLVRPNWKKINLYCYKMKSQKNSFVENTKKDLFRASDKDYYDNKITCLSQEIAAIVKTTKKKTLVVCYKQIDSIDDKRFYFEKDLVEELSEEIDDSVEYSVIHFGQSSTGVNDYRDYENIVIVGMLLKPQVYYTHKAKITGIDDIDRIRTNELAVEMIQQIGRTCVREKKAANVYFFGTEDYGAFQKVGQFYRINEAETRVGKYYNERKCGTDAKKNKTIYRIMDILDGLEECGEEISEEEIIKQLSDLKKATVTRRIRDEDVMKYAKDIGVYYDKEDKVFIK